MDLEELSNIVSPQYLKVLLFENEGEDNPYHNTYHNLCVARSCWNGAVYEGMLATNKGKYDAQTLVIAGILHDIGHVGRMGNDDKNIACAIEVVARILLPEDKPRFEGIKLLLETTEFLPTGFKYPNEELSLSAKILRDAEMSQLFEDNWFQQIMVGLRTEFGKNLSEFIPQQIRFVKGIEWQTNWGKALAAEKMPGLLRQLSFLHDISKS